MRRWCAAMVLATAVMAAATAGCSRSETTSASAGGSTSAPTTSATPGTKPDASTGTTGKRSSTTTAPTTTAAPGSPKAVYLADGNAICKKMNAESMALTQQYDSSAKTPALTQQFLDANADLIAHAVDDLEALPQPPGDEAQLAAMYADGRKLVALAHQMAAASARSDKAAIEALGAQGDPLQKSSNAALTAYGLTECGKGD